MLRSGHAPEQPFEVYVPEQPQTMRQQIVESLQGTLCSAYQLAGMLRIREREVEEHLTHIVKTVARDRTKQFVIDPASCVECGYVFRGRTKLTTPSRCPKCKSEGVSPPRFGIQVRT